MQLKQSHNYWRCWHVSDWRSRPPVSRREVQFLCKLWRMRTSNCPYVGCKDVWNSETLFSFRTIYMVLIYIYLFIYYIIEGTPLWSSGQTSLRQTQRSRIRVPALPHFLSSSGSGTESTQPPEDKWGATWMKSSGSGLVTDINGRGVSAALTTRHPSIHKSWH
jgi:hypothetical protein